VSTTVHRIVTSAICLVIAFAALPRLLRADTLINFDDVKDKTDIRTHYQAQGVTFACEGAACSFAANANGIFARATAMAASAPNAITPVRDGIPGVVDDLTGRIAATFNHPVSTVSIDALTVLVPEPKGQASYANLVAYDAKGDIVASAISDQRNSFQTLTVNTPENTIVKVSLGVTGNLAIAVFDNLHFDTTSTKFSWTWIVIVVVALLLGLLVFAKMKRKPR
jgi:hypothetical protein